MTLLDFCKQEGFTTVDHFAVNLYRESGEQDRAWRDWMTVHGDREWRAFWKFQHDEIMKSHRRHEREQAKARKAKEKNHDT